MFKAKVASSAVNRDSTLPEIAQFIDVNPNQVWAADVTYIPMARGFVAHVAVDGWFRHRILSRRRSNILTADSCVEALKEAIARYGGPEIFNTDQGSRFATLHIAGVLKRHKIRITMDGRGARRDDVFVERLWQSIKYDEVYPNVYDSVSPSTDAIARDVAFLNTRRLNNSLDRRTSGHVRSQSLSLAAPRKSHNSTLSGRDTRPEERDNAS